MPAQETPVKSRAQMAHASACWETQASELEAGRMCIYKYNNICTLIMFVCLSPTSIKLRSGACQHQDPLLWPKGGLGIDAKDVFFKGCGVILLMEEIRLTSWYGRYPHYLQGFYTSEVVFLGISSINSTVDTESIGKALHLVISWRVVLICPKNHRTLQWKGPWTSMTQGPSK